MIAEVVPLTAEPKLDHAVCPVARSWGWYVIGAVPTVTAVHVRTSDDVVIWLATSPVTAAGGVPGIVVTVIGDDVADPEGFVAVTSRSYCVPGVRDGTVTVRLPVGAPTGVKLTGSAIVGPRGESLDRRAARWLPCVCRRRL